MSGGSIYDLKKVLSHADVKTTERYAHLSADHLASVRDIIKPNIGSKAEILELGVQTLMQVPVTTQDPILSAPRQFKDLAST
jgi:hypothetical protein